MSIRVTCEKCGVVLKVKEDLAGTKGKCPACKGTLNVPTLEEAAAQAAGGPLSATETAAAAAVGDTGAIKIPATKTKSAKVASAPDEGGPPPPPEANGSATAHAPAGGEQGTRPKHDVAPAPMGESTTDDLAEPSSDKKPSKPGKSRLTMDDSDANAPPAAPPVDKPKRADAAKPAAESKPTPPPPDKETPAPKNAKGGDGEFDLDSFLMEGPKPKALPPVPEEGAAKKGAPPPRAGGGRKLSMSDDETNVSGPSETLPPPNRRGSAADSAMAALTGGGSQSSAKDLLAKASQEGRARAASMPEDQRERLDITGALRDIGKEYGLHVFGTIALCAVLYFGMDYMMGSGQDLPPLARIYGRVTVKKQPIQGVVVTFTPVGAKDSKENATKLKKGVPRSATGMTDKDGHFELMYEEGVRGAVVGQNRVWIDPSSPENYKKIPGIWTNIGNPEIREVKKTGGEENIDIP